MASRYLLSAALAAAMMTTASGMDAQQCRNGGVRVGDLGFDDIGGSIHTVQRNNERPQIQFEGEPEIGGVRSNGPAAGRLRDGDVIVAIDGQLITTRSAGQRFSAVDPGDQVRLSIRRGGRVQDVTIVAGSRCTAVPPTPPAPPRPPRPGRPGVPETPGAAPTPPTPPRAGVPAPPAALDRPGAPPAPPRPPRETVPNAPPAPATPPVPPVPPAPPAPPEIMPDGWFGFGIQCRNCGVHSENGRAALFRFGEAPTVVNVEPGTPAAGAGMRRGDRLTHVDGVSLTTRDGWRRFGAIQPGQRVAWTYTRDGRRHQATMTALRRPDAGRAPAAAARDQRLRYSGTVGGAEVEVRGAPVTVSTDPRTGETVIRSADTTVRIRPRS